MCRYAYMLLKGDGILVNKDEAAKYLKLAADKGNKEAILRYANMLINEHAVEKNRKDLARYYELIFFFFLE